MALPLQQAVLTHACALCHLTPCLLLLQAAGIDKREVGRIMQKLGQKGTTEEGLMDLYQYMQKHPHLKLDQIMNLSVASATFRKYLEDGLRKAAYRDKLAREGEQYQSVVRRSCCCHHGIAQSDDWPPVRGFLDCQSRHVPE